MCYCSSIVSYFFDLASVSNHFQEIKEFYMEKHPRSLENPDNIRETVRFKIIKGIIEGIIFLS